MDTLIFGMLILAIGAVVMWGHVGSVVRRSGVDYWSGRTLVVAATVNTMLCGVLAASQSMAFLVSSSHSWFSCLQWGVSLFLLILPFRCIYHYLLMSTRLVRAYCLVSAEASPLRASVEQLCANLGIRVPFLMSSPSVATPFVFHSRASGPCLALPANWTTTPNTAQQTVLLHELAHIRNGDVTFSTWAFAITNDIKHLVIVAPAIALIWPRPSPQAAVDALFSPQTSPPPALHALLMYWFCMLHLWVVLRWVMRSREVLADLTASRAFGSDQVETALAAESTRLAGSLETSGRIRATSSLLGHAAKWVVAFIQAIAAVSPHASAKEFAQLVQCFRMTADKNAGLVERARQWVTDKTLFGPEPRPRRLLYDLLEFCCSMHPPADSRSKEISDEDHSMGRSVIGAMDSLLIGTILGLVAVNLAIGGRRVGALILDARLIADPDKVSRGLLALVGPAAVGVTSLLIALPTWAATTTASLSWSRVKLLPARCVIGVLGAWTACMAMNLGARQTDAETAESFWLAVQWCNIVVIGGFAMTLGLMMLGPSVNPLLRRR